MHEQKSSTKIFRYKKTYLNVLAVVICFIGFFLFIGLFIHTFRYLGRFEPLLHLLILVFMGVYLLVIKVSIAPPAYIKLGYKQLSVKRSLLGKWNEVNLSNIVKTELTDDQEFLVVYTSQKDLPEVKLKLSNLTDSESAELKKLLGGRQSNI